MSFKDVGIKKSRVAMIFMVGLGFAILQFDGTRTIAGGLYASLPTSMDASNFALSAVNFSAAALSSAVDSTLLPSDAITMNTSEFMFLESESIDDSSSSLASASDINTSSSKVILEDFVSNKTISAPTVYPSNNTQSAANSSTAPEVIVAPNSKPADIVVVDSNNKNDTSTARSHVVLNKCLVQANDKYIRALSKQWDDQLLPQFGSIVRAPNRFPKNDTILWYATFSIKRLKYSVKEAFRRRDIIKKWMIQADWRCDDERGRFLGDPQMQDMIVIQCPNERVSEIRVRNTTYFVGAHVECALQSPLKEPVGEIAGGAFLFAKAAKTVSDLIPWMEYHRMIGVDHYYLYLMHSYTAEEEKMLPNLPYVTYVPFLLMEPKQVGRRRWGGSRIFGFQPPQMQDLLYRARSAGFKWLFYNDADEYLQVMGGSLGSYLSENVGYLEVKTWTFGNPEKNHPGRLQRPPQFDMDFVWRNPAPFTGRQKCLVRPDRINLYDVHKVKSGDGGRILNPEKEMRLNHYKGAMGGIFGLEENQSAPVRDTSFRDQFRDELVERVNKTNILLSL